MYIHVYIYIYIYRPILYFSNQRVISAICLDHTRDYIYTIPLNVPIKVLFLYSYIPIFLYNK